MAEICWSNIESSPVRELLKGIRKDELLRELSRLDAGRIQIGTGVGLPANAIMVDDQGDGRTKITVLYQPQHERQ